MSPIWRCISSSGSAATATRNGPNVIQTTAMVRGVPCTIHGRTEVDKGRCPFYSIFMGTGIPRPSQAQSFAGCIPTYHWPWSYHVTSAIGTAWDAVQGETPWRTGPKMSMGRCATNGGDWWIGGASSVLQLAMCLKSIQMNGETSFIQHIYIYPLVN